MNHSYAKYVNLKETILVMSKNRNMYGHKKVKFIFWIPAVQDKACREDRKDDDYWGVEDQGICDEHVRRVWQASHPPPGGTYQAQQQL